MTLHLRLFNRPHQPLVECSILTSGPYPVIAMDALAAAGTVEHREYEAFFERLMVGGQVTAMQLQLTTAYVSHDHRPAEDNLLATGELVGVALVVTTTYNSHHVDEDKLFAAGEVRGLTLLVTTGYVHHDHRPAQDNLTATGQVTGIALT